MTPVKNHLGKCFVPETRSISTVSLISTYVKRSLSLYNSLCCRNLKIPSRRPSIVCENCLYSLERDMRARAFHILEPKGAVDMLIIFLEERSVGSHPLLDNAGVSKLLYMQLLCVFVYIYCKFSLISHFEFLSGHDK